MGAQLTPGQVAGAVKRTAAAVREAIRVGAIRGAERGRAFVVRQTPVDQGQLKASWKVRPSMAAAAATRGAQMLAELVNDAPHAGIVERGARPHPVSPEGWMAIYDWVVRHRQELGIVTAGGNARRVKAGTKVINPILQGGGVGLDPEIGAITNAIVWKLKTRGQVPTYFVRGSLETLRNILDAEVRGAVDAALRKAQSTGGI
jgi:hypothetical protein